MQWLEPDSLDFPDVATALEEPNGLLAVGGDLRVERLVAAYQRGIFPWYEADQPVLWWSPDPRLVLYPDELHISRSLQKICRNNPFQFSIDEAFCQVVDACAAPREYEDRTWISSAMESAYSSLHDKNIAHSVEVWQDARLVGGLYGVALGHVFFGESMFSRVSNTSKLALVFLMQHLRKWGYHVVDCQIYSSHLESLGAREISREKFCAVLAEFVGDSSQSRHWRAVRPTRLITEKS